MSTRSIKTAMVWLLTGTLTVAAAQSLSAQESQKQPDAKRNLPPSAERVNDRSSPQRPRDDARTAGARQVRESLGVKFGKDGQLIVESVADGSAAARSGLQPNDRIISAFGREFSGSRQFLAFLAAHGGRRVPVIIERNGRQYTIQLTPPAGDEGAWLGVYLQHDDQVKNGARVTTVFPGGPASRAGLQMGDTIVQVNDRKVDEPSDVILLMQELDPGAQVEFVVLRDSSELKVPVTLGRRDAFMSRPRGPDDGNRDDEGADDDPYDSIPPHAMQLEHDRRNAEQHERIEHELQLLREEIRQLRDLLQQRK